MSKTRYSYSFQKFSIDQMRLPQKLTRRLFSSLSSAIEAPPPPPRQTSSKDAAQRSHSFQLLRRDFLLEELSLRRIASDLNAHNGDETTAESIDAAASALPQLLVAKMNFSFSLRYQNSFDLSWHSPEKPTKFIVTTDYVLNNKKNCEIRQICLFSLVYHLIKITNESCSASCRPSFRSDVP